MLKRLKSILRARTTFKSASKSFRYQTVKKAELIFAIGTMTGVEAPSSSFPDEETNDLETKKKSEKLKNLLYNSKV